MSANPTTALGLLRRKECWTLSLRGRLVVLGFCGLTAATVILRLHPFLAVHAPAVADVLVVEGWVSDVTLEAAAKEFRERSYAKLYVTGGPLSRGSYLIEFETFADLGAAALQRLGIDKNQLVAVSAPPAYENRTLHSAQALRCYFDASGIKPTAINVITEGAHARRSRLLFRRALDNATQVGVISVDNPEYDPRRWWAYSEGWKTMIGETLGYVYVKIRGINGR